MTTEVAGLTLAAIDTTCWIACFWWMHRISSRQDSLLQELHDVTQRIETLSREEHDLIKEVHPIVTQIKESVDGVAETVSDKT